MTPNELRATIALASIMSMRMLGLFMILPVFALYAQHLPNTTPTLVGVAIGIYGLTQAILQFLLECYPIVLDVNQLFIPVC
jgi:uncharacterized membrane protein (DUF485 family)